MDAQTFREFGRAATYVIADYMENIRELDVLPSVEPGELINSLPKEAPEQPEDWQDVLKDFSQSIIPGVTHWHSPRFHAFYPTGTSYASVIGNMLSDGLGIVGFSWGSASEATLVALLAAKDRTVRRLVNKDPSLDKDEIKSKLVAYTSDQCNSSVEKAGLLGSMKMKQLKADRDGRLRGETLKRAFEEDRAQGLIPCYVVANIGTTGTCAFDPLYELGPVCNEADVWLHVDAAYAGAAFLCPEYRHLMKGIECADSVDVNPHKWMPVNLDCSAMWLKNSYDVIKAFHVHRIYLDDIKTDTKIPDYRHWQIPLGRRFRALKLWTVMRIHGAEGLRKHVRDHIDLAQYFAKLVRDDERFVVEPEPSMGLVCFRLKEGDIVTKKLLQNLTEKKKVFMVACTYRERFVIRLVICSAQMKKEDVDYSWKQVKDEANLLCSTIHMKAHIPVFDQVVTRDKCFS